MSRGWWVGLFLAWCVACSGGDTGRGAPSPGGGGSGGDPANAGEGGSAGDFGNAGPSTGGTTSSAAGTGASAASPDAGAGSFTVGRMELDPDAMFVWKETVPGQGNCEPGRYAGTFTCNYVAMGGNPAMPAAIVNGPVTLTLEKSQNGEFLEITDGKLEGIAALIFGFRAELQGQLNCADDTFEATAVNGVYGFGDPAIFPVGTFQGTMSGTLDRSTVALSGDWQMAEMSGGSCDGPWNTAWTP